MSTFNSALQTYLLADSDITDIVGAEGIYVFPANQSSSIPYVVVQRITKEPMSTLQNPLPVVREEWQLDCIAPTYAQADALELAVENRVNNASPVTMSGFDVSLIIVTNIADLSELEDDGSNQKAERRTLQVTVKRTPTT
jgi:hypothetical protein